MGETRATRYQAAAVWFHNGSGGDEVSRHIRLSVGGANAYRLTYAC